MFELEDQQWFPAYLRRMQVEYIGWLAMSFAVYRFLAPVIARVLSKARTNRVIDLGSGSGGPILQLATSNELLIVDFLLTDRYPSPQPTGQPRVAWSHEPIDALTGSVPDGFRTMFNAYHHFSEEEKQQLIVVHGRHGLLIAELLQPNIICALQILFVTTIGQILLCPFVKPFRWDRLFFTWIVPINLITVAWDGIVSVVRVDDREAMEARALRFAPAGCIVESGTSGSWWSRVTWLAVIPDRS